MFRVCLLFYTYDSANFKSIGNNTMKKMCYSLLRWPCLLQDAQQIIVQNKPAAVAPKETITHHFFVSGIGQKKNCRCSQNLWRRRKCCCRNPANIRKWIARFYYFRHLYPLEARVYCSHNCMSCPSIWALYLHCSLIYFWVLPVVLA